MFSSSRKCLRHEHVRAQFFEPQSQVICSTCDRGNTAGGDARRTAGETPALRFRRALRIRNVEKENRAGWPGFLCVELDAVTSQRGATGAEAAFSGWVRTSPVARKCFLMPSPDRRTEVEDPKEQRKQTESETQVECQACSSSKNTKKSCK